MSNSTISFDARQYNHPGGVARYIESLLEKYTKIKPPARIKLLGNKKSLKKDFKKNFSYNDLSTRLFSPLEQATIPFKVRDTKLYHSPNFNAPLLYSGQLVVTVHDLTLIKFPELNRNRFIYQYIKLLMKMSARKADRIIAVSNNTKKDIQEIFDVNKNKIKVIHNGISDHFRQIKNKELVREFKKEKGLPEDYILSLGNLKPHKNLPRLIDAVEEVQGKLKDFALVITGKGDVESKLKEKVSEMGLSNKIKFTGYVDNSELPLLYNGARLFVYPSLNEGFGFPPLEAMACGTPTVASEVSSIPEVTGDAALLVDPYDPKAIAEGIQHLWSDSKLRDQYIEKGLKRVTTFSWKSCAEETLSVYEKVLKNGR